MKLNPQDIILIAIAILSGAALLWPVLTLRGKRGSALEVTQMINRGKTVLLDVRNAQQFATGHVREARNIPLAELSKRIGELEKMKSKTIIVLCQTGAQSASAARTLTKAGFSDVVRLDGGLAAWKTQGLPLAK